MESQGIGHTRRLFCPHEGGDSLLVALHLSTALVVDLLLLQGKRRTLAKALD